MPDAAPAGALRRQSGMSVPAGGPAAAGDEGSDGYDGPAGPSAGDGPAEGAGELPVEGDGAATELGASFGVPTGVRRILAPTAGATRIVLVRHGEAVCNVNGIVGGIRGCTGLTGLGRRQVSALARRLERTGELAGATALYASVLPRAVETAEILRPVVGDGKLDVVQECALCELHPGESDGLTWQEVVDRFGVPEWDTDPDTLIAPGGESWSAFVPRAAAAVRSLAAAAPGRAGGGRRSRRGDRVLHDLIPGDPAGRVAPGLDPHCACVADRVGVGPDRVPLGAHPLQRCLRHPDGVGGGFSRRSRRRPRWCCRCIGRTRPVPWAAAPWPASRRRRRTSTDRSGG